jgi:tetratricopeptide (TPR) repeat protein
LIIRALGAHWRSRKRRLDLQPGQPIRPPLGVRLTSSGFVWLLSVLLGLQTVDRCWAQDGLPDDLIDQEVPLIDQQPFDLIHLTEEAGGEIHKVFPIPLPNRRAPENPPPNSKIEVVLKQFPDRRYELAWKWIERIDLYEDMILEEAKQRLSENDFVRAFQNLSHLMRNFPDTPKLESLRREFLFGSLSVSYSNGQLEQTLSTLEELRQSAPNFREQAVSRALNNVSRALIDRYEKAGDIASANRLVDRLERTYGGIEVVGLWRERVERMAESKLNEAKSLFDQKRYREAYTAVLASLSISPGRQDSRNLLEELSSNYPIIRVGVMQRSERLDPTSLSDWSARRAGLLVERPLMQFLQTGNEGGKYSFALGRLRVSDDRRSLMLTLDPSKSNESVIRGFIQLVVDRADPEHSLYEAEWASIFESIESRGTSQITIRLRRPHVLPHALMQWRMREGLGMHQGLEIQEELGMHEELAALGLAAPYHQTDLSSQEAVFSLRPEWQASEYPAEVVEIFYRDARQAINDLARGHIDVIDQLYPSDARALAGDSRFRVFSYALPSTHLLIPVSDHAYLSKGKFRRALLYATNREEMLRDELLNSGDSRDGKLISGPFPAGQTGSDPLAYATDARIQPTSYDPQLAKLLISICQTEFESAAQKSGERPPTLEKLVVGCPDFEFARVAVQAIIQQWAIVGIEAEMILLPSSDPAEWNGRCDLVYLMTTLWEPATDIQRLMGDGGVAASDNPFIVQGLARLRDSLGWRDVRDSLQDLHQLIAYHLPVLPLWQVTDRFAARRGIQGIPDRPVTLYQDLAEWRLEQNPSSSD